MHPKSVHFQLDVSSTQLIAISFNSMYLEFYVSLTQCIFVTLPKAQRTQAWSPKTRLTTYVKSARFKHFDQNSELST